MTQAFFLDTVLSEPILYFKYCAHYVHFKYTRKAQYAAYFAPHALFPCRGVPGLTDKHTVNNNIIQMGFLNFQMTRM